MHGGSLDTALADTFAVRPCVERSRTRPRGRARGHIGVAEPVDAGDPGTPRRRSHTGGLGGV